MYQKLLTASAVATALGLSATAANAFTVDSITLQDVDGDGAVSGFRFATMFDISFPTGIPGTFPNDLTFTGDTGNDLITGGPQAAGSFTTGFNFGGGGDFVPSITVTSAIHASATLDITALDFGGLYNGTTYLLAPQDGAQAGIPGGLVDGEVLPGDGAFTGFSSTGVDYYLDYYNDNGDGTYDFIIRWSSVISQGSSFDGSIARWRLEGTFNTSGADAHVPVPAAAWLFGSGLLGLVGVARRKKSL